MSTQSLHLIDKEVEQEERMEIRSRVDSPSERPLALEMLMSSIASQLTTMQSSFSHQLTSMSYQQSHLNAELMERLDRVEESIHGSGKGSPDPDSWTYRPVVTSF